MERTLSVEEKIKRAEEIYLRRKSADDTDNRCYIKNKNIEKKNKRITRRIIFQMIICLGIYMVCYIVSNNKYIFSDDFKNKTNEIISCDANITQIYENIKVLIRGNVLNDNNKEEKEEIKEEDNVQNEENIGGSIETQESNELSSQEAEKTLTEQEQMEKDAKEIKETVSFITPVQGNISSTFGWRNPTTSTVPKYHTGLDIAASTGTEISSATDGKVVLKSSQGDYGNHLKIQIDNIIIVYAHCNKIYVNEGETITKGQKIAEVGSTGNSTGPHLHFEIRKDDRLIDPQLVLDI